MSDVSDDEVGSPVGLPTSSMPEAFTRLHREAKRLLREWQAPSAALDATRQRMLDVLAEDSGAMWRHHSRVHFTTSLVVLDPSASYVALTLHTKAKRWFQFGGHVEEQDGGLLEAALREGREESGLGMLHPLDGLVQVDAHRLPGTFGWCREHLDLRFAAVAGREMEAVVSENPEADLVDLAVSDESDDVRWFPVDALPEDTDDSLCQAIELAAQRVRGAKAYSNL